MRDSCLGDQYCFAGGCDSEDILHALTKLAPDCNSCPGKRLYLCVEECCVGAQPFCLQCEKELHFLHRKNQLRMLFIDRRALSTFSQNKKQLLRDLQQYIQQKKKNVEGWVLQGLQDIMRDEQAIHDMQERLRTTQVSVDYGVKLIASCQRLLMSIRLSECRMTTDWQQTMYQLVQRSVEGNRISLTDKLQFHQALLNINLYEQKVEDSIEQFCLLEAPGSWEELPLVRVENVYWINGDLADLLRQFEKKPNLETLVRETNIQRYFSCHDKQIYWHTTNSIHRSRILHAGYGGSKGTRLILIGGEQPIYDLVFKNTVTQLYYDQEKTALASLPVRLRALTVSGRLSSLPQLPESIERLKLMLTDPIARESGLSISSWSCPLIQRLQKLPHLKYLTVNCAHLSHRQLKKLVGFARQKNLRMLVPLTIQIALCEYTVLKLENIFSHVFTELKHHYLRYKRRLLQIALLHRTTLHFNQRILEGILHYAKSDTDVEEDY